MSTPTTLQQSTTPYSVLRRLVARHPVATFLIMAYAITSVFALSPIRTRLDILLPELPFWDVLATVFGVGLPAFLVVAAADGRSGVRDLAGAVSGDPAPDLMGISPNGNRVFITLRGPNPLTGNVPGVNNAVGSTPSLGIVRVEQNGERGVLQAIAPITHIVSGVELADPHGLAVRLK